MDKKACVHSYEWTRMPQDQRGGTFFMQRVAKEVMETLDEIEEVIVHVPKTKP